MTLEEDQDRLTVSLIRSETSTNNQTIESNTIKLSYFFLVTDPGEYEFNYNIADNPLAVFADCEQENLCYHCKYDINIVISDGCDELYNQSFDNYDLNSWNSLCTNQYPNLVHPPIIIDFVNPGQYSITKHLH
ncbi:MAG: hypothetical protein IPK10_05460 [Bacteroidetes bacterium]|nr:hypothetical protein [Bacteroidota bacterium]